MNFTTLVIGYGDAQGHGRGIYQINANNEMLSSTLMFTCAEKPGAMIQLGERFYLSYQGQEHAGIYVFAMNAALELCLSQQLSLPYFITSFAHGPNEQTLLGSSFYDGVDLLLRITDAIEVMDVNTHAYRPRSDDPRQTSAHPHHIQLFPNRALAYSVDMGTDCVSLYTVTDQGLSLQNEMLLDCPIGSGPRIMRVRCDGEYAYLLNEIGNRITVYAINKSDDAQSIVMREIQQISACKPETQVSNSPAACVMTDDERYLLISNRGENSLVLFQIDAKTGLLTERDRISTGLTPRDVCISGHQIMVAAQTANTVQLFQIDAEQHRLRYCDETHDVMSPVAFVLR